MAPKKFQKVPVQNFDKAKGSVNKLQGFLIVSLHFDLYFTPKQKNWGIRVKSFLTLGLIITHINILYFKIETVIKSYHLFIFFI